MDIHKAFLGAQREAKNPPLDSTNPYFKSRYASLSAVLESVRPALFNNGFYIKQTVHTTETNDLQVSTSAVWTETGEEIGPILITYPLPRNSDNLAQDIGKIITYLRRYSLITLMGIVGEEDDDAQGLTQSSPPKAEPRYQPPKQTSSKDVMEAFAKLGLDMAVLEREMSVLAKNRDRAADVYKKTKAALEVLSEQGLNRKFLEVVKKEGSLSSSPTPLQDMLKAYYDSRELFIPWLQKYGDNV